jgi:hypothetical protein
VIGRRQFAMALEVGLKEALLDELWIIVVVERAFDRKSLAAKQRFDFFSHDLVGSSGVK